MDRGRRLGDVTVSVAKAPSVFDDLELCFPIFDAKALDLRNPISDAKAQNL